MPTTNRRGKSKELIRDRGVLSFEQTLRFKAVVAGLLDAGFEPRQIAKAIEPRDPAARRETRNVLMGMLANDRELQQMVADRSRAKMIAALPAITEALVARAQRGRPDAIKLVFAATGFYDPKLQRHQHTGEVKIVVSIPRPRTLPNEADERDVVDAEVVE
jgi:hypothetical protein